MYGLASTVQFSNHTGYSEYSGEIFNPKQISNLLQTIENLGFVPQCKAIYRKRPL